MHARVTIGSCANISPETLWMPLPIISPLKPSVEGLQPRADRFDAEAWTMMTLQISSSECHITTFGLQGPVFWPMH